MRFIAIVAVGACALSACAETELMEEGSPHRPLAVDLACPAAGGALALATTPEIARQGDRLALHASVRWGPGGAEPVPIACLQDVTVSPAGSARWDAADGLITLLPGAVPGEQITVSARWRDGDASHALRVVGAQQVVLTGTWSQEQVKCDPGIPPREPVRELKIRDGGGFGVTYQPFESYVDYWGALSFEPTTGALNLTPDGGNFTPSYLDGEGVARLETDRRLVLENVYLGARDEPNFNPRTDDKGAFVLDDEGRLIFDRPSCTYVFVR